jgi:hypothetical protein
VTDYSEESVLSILDSTRASVLISTIQCPEDSYIRIHQGFLNACLRSVHCKRFIPSEWAGNIEDYPGLPRAYGKSRAPFRAILQQSHGVEWTLFNHGWFMDYFVPQDKSYMKCTPGEFPFDLKLWTYCVKGTGDEPQSWTCGRDVAKAVTELLTAREWVSGQDRASSSTPLKPIAGTRHLRCWTMGHFQRSSQDYGKVLW